MRTLSDREKKLIRYSAAGICIYLVLFFLWKPLHKKCAEYDQLVKDAKALQLKIEPYNARVEGVKKLMNTFKLDPATLTNAVLVGETSAAIQQAATSSGIKVGPVRETQSHGSSKELASVQFEGTGPVPAVIGLLKRMESLGYPLVIDSVQITPEKNRPGQVKMNLTVVILDFEQWKQEENTHA